MIKPRVRPQDKGFKFGDHHLVINAASGTAKAYTFAGLLAWSAPCLAMGMHGDWTANQGDTPPGLYRIGEVYNDFAIHGIHAPYSRELASFGWCSFDMIDLEGNEDNNGRAGIMIHGGGSGLGWAGAWAEYQALLPTRGCIRMHNRDLKDKLLPLRVRGSVFVSVYQVA